MNKNGKKIPYNNKPNKPIYNCFFYYDNQHIVGTDLKQPIILSYLTIIIN